MMATASATAAAQPQRRPKYGSMSRDRQWALRWSYFFLVLFAIFFLLPPIYMLITSLKTSAGDLGGAPTRGGSTIPRWRTTWSC